MLLNLDNSNNSQLSQEPEDSIPHPQTPPETRHHNDEHVHPTTQHSPSETIPYPSPTELDYDPDTFQPQTPTNDEHHDQNEPWTHPLDMLYPSDNPDDLETY
jgi:hypothetical protein